LVCRAQKDPSALVVEQVAAFAIKSKLRSYSAVHFDVECTALGLIAGKVDGAGMTGYGWESPLGLSARLLQMRVGGTSLDYPGVLAQQRIVLTTQPLGSARCVFDEADFGAFLTHQLVRTAASSAVRGQPFLFDADSVVVHAPKSHSSDAMAATAVAAQPAAATAGAGSKSKPAPVMPSMPGGSESSQPWLQQGQAPVQRMQGPTLHPPVMHPLGKPDHSHQGESAITGLGMGEHVFDPLSDHGVAAGYITCTGTWQGKKYSLAICPKPGQGRAGKASVQVHAHAMAHATSHHLESEGVQQRFASSNAAEEEAVSLELSHFFSNLMVDLHGAELSFSSLTLLPPSHPDVAAINRSLATHYVGGAGSLGKANSGNNKKPAASGSAAPGSAAAHQILRAGAEFTHQSPKHAAPTGPWIDLQLKLRVRQFPPLDAMF